MAYAAVASLSQTIDIILNHHQAYATPEFQNQIISLRNHSVFLQSFAEDFLDRANNWDETIREVTDRAEEIVELLLSDSFLESKSTDGSSSKPKLEKGENEVDYSFDELERVTTEMESVANRLKGKRAEATGDSDEELMGLISRLRGGSSERETIAIVGMGGMGKTDLARNAYNHPLIVEHFLIRGWSTISSDYSWRGIVSDLLRSMKAEEIISDASYIHQMRLLDEDKRWNLLRKKIFKGDPCPSRLESMGKEIARKCRGHPLSIDVVSGILSADQTEATWEEVSETMELVSENVDKRIFEVLSLSYTYLPHHLRPCFLYLACFPENQEILLSKLIKLWVAEGFVNESEYKSYEEMGEERVEDLVRRSLVSVRKRKSNGRIKSIAVHVVMRDLCLRQARIDNFTHRVGGYYRHIEAGELRSYRRVSTSSNADILEGVYGSTIRTIMLYLHDSRLGVESIGNLSLLRILDLSNGDDNYYDLPEAVFDLFHLRFLAFHSKFSVSEAISNLENLQTLVICPRENDGRMFGKFPEGIWRMPQLRHLNVFPFELPSPKGVTTSALENLQTLSRVVDFICSRENLKMIPNLKKLGIFYSNNFRDAMEDYELHNLKHLQKLEILKIEITWSFVEEQSFAFPPTLKKLNLCGVQLPWEDMKIVASLPNLQVLKLRKNACIGERWETSEGGFPQLTYLLIEECNLVHWITESDHFPTLKCLVLRCCMHLLEVPNGIGRIPTLELIELDDQENHSLWRSAIQIQEDRQSLGYGHLQIR